MFNSMWPGYNVLEARFVRASTIQFSNLGTWPIMNLQTQQPGNMTESDIVPFNYF